MGQDATGSAAEATRVRLRASLTAALKARDAAAVSALRSAMSALSNAEAVEVVASQAQLGGEHVAGAAVGVGAAEAERRSLSAAEVQAVLRAEVEERRASAHDYRRHQQLDRADRLEAEADALSPFL